MEFQQFTENLTIPIGSTYDPDPWTFSSGETEATAVPIDLTGCEAEMHIRDKVDSPTILLELTTTNGRLILGGTAGTIAISLPVSVTNAITWSKGVYDLRIIFPGGITEYLIGGAVSAVKKVTRSA